MSKSSNDFGVNFSEIMWLNKILCNHANVDEVLRTKDIQFDLTRKRGGDVRLVCLNEYTCGLTRI
jgi:hypothetical protein